MFGFLRTYREAKAAQRGLTAAFKERGHNFMQLHSTVHEALVKEAMATGVAATMEHFDYIERIYNESRDDIVRLYKERSKQFSVRGDRLETEAALLVGTANKLGTNMFARFVGEFPSIPHDERGQEYWDFVITIAGVFVALTRLRILNLDEKRRLKLEKKVAANLVQLYPTVARPAFEKCKSFFDKSYDVLLDAGYESQLIASDAIGGWIAFEILNRAPKTDQEVKLVRQVGIMIVQSFFNWWEKDGDQRTVR